MYIDLFGEGGQHFASVQDGADSIRCPGSWKSRFIQADPSIFEHAYLLLTSC